MSAFSPLSSSFFYIFQRCFSNLKSLKMHCAMVPTGPSAGTGAGDGAPRVWGVRKASGTKTRRMGSGLVPNVQIGLVATWGGESQGRKGLRSQIKGAGWLEARK